MTVRGEGVQSPREEPQHYPTRGHLLVCTGPSCAARGARELFERLWLRLELEQLAYYRSGGSIRLTECGCLGACSYGPSVTCYTAGGEAWYAGMDEELTVGIARAIQAGDELPAEGRYDDG